MAEFHCPYCGAIVSPDATVCPVCGAKLKKSMFKIIGRDGVMK